MPWVPIDEDAVYAMTVFDHAPKGLQAQVRLEGEEPLQDWWARLSDEKQERILADGRSRLMRLRLQWLALDGRNY